MGEIRIESYWFRPDPVMHEQHKTQRNICFYLELLERVAEMGERYTGGEHRVLGNFCCIPRYISRELQWVWRSWDLNFHLALIRVASIRGGGFTFCATMSTSKIFFKHIIFIDRCERIRKGLSTAF